MRNLIRETQSNPWKGLIALLQVLWSDPPSRTGIVRLATLAVLTLCTSLALLSTSVWLVFPYWGLMAWLLQEPVRGWLVPIQKFWRASQVNVPPVSPLKTGQTSARLAANPASTQDNNSHPAAAVISTQVASSLVHQVETVTVPATPSTAVAENPPEKRNRRGRKPGSGKNRIPEPLQPEPDQARWVRVGPGKFIRVDACSPDFQTPEAEAGIGTGRAQETVTTNSQASAGDAAIRAPDSELSAANRMLGSTAVLGPIVKVETSLESIPDAVPYSALGSQDESGTSFPNAVAQMLESEQVLTYSAKGVEDPIVEVETHSSQLSLTDDIEAENFDSEQVLADSDDQAEEPILDTDNALSDPALTAVSEELPLVNGPVWIDFPAEANGLIGETEPERSAVSESKEEILPLIDSLSNDLLSEELDNSRTSPLTNQCLLEEMSLLPPEGPQTRLFPIESIPATLGTVLEPRHPSPTVAVVADVKVSDFLDRSVEGSVEKAVALLSGGSNGIPQVELGTVEESAFSGCNLAMSGFFPLDETFDGEPVSTLDGALNEESTLRISDIGIPEVAYPVPGLPARSWPREYRTTFVRSRTTRSGASKRQRIRWYSGEEATNRLDVRGGQPHQNERGPPES